MTTNAFAKFLGYPRSETLYQIKRGNYGISMKLADRIVARFPEISRLWLLTGEGDMFGSDDTRSVAVPYYDEDVRRGLTIADRLEPCSQIVVPAVVRCDLAMRLDDGCAPDTTHIVLLQRCEGETPVAGEYAVLCEGDEGDEGGVRLLRAEEAGRDGRCPGHVICRITGHILLDGFRRQP